MKICEWKSNVKYLFLKSQSFLQNKKIKIISVLNIQQQNQQAFVFIATIAIYSLLK